MSGLVEEHVPSGGPDWTPQSLSSATRIYPLPHSNIWSPASAAIGEGARMRGRLARRFASDAGCKSQTTDIA